jgi:hypothetical protein
VQRIRTACSQSILTTHSPSVASHYSPHEILFVRNENGDLMAEPLWKEELDLTAPNAFQKLFVTRRTELCNALMSRYVLLPEGQGDADWINLMVRIYEAQGMSDPQEVMPSVSGIGVVPTQDANVLQTYKEICRVRPDIVPFLDGDTRGQEFVNLLSQCEAPPPKIIRLANGLNREDLICWLMEPMLVDSVATLRQSFDNNLIADKVTLRRAIIDAKTNVVLLENLAWDAQRHAGSLARCKKFLEDIGRILERAPDRLEGWTVQNQSTRQGLVYIAEMLL